MISIGTNNKIFLFKSLVIQALIVMSAKLKSVFMPLHVAPLIAFPFHQVPHKPHFGMKEKKRYQRETEGSNLFSCISVYDSLTSEQENVFFK